MAGVLLFSFRTVEQGVQRHRYRRDKQEAAPQHGGVFLPERVGDTHGHTNYDAEGRQDVLQASCFHGY